MRSYFGIKELYPKYPVQIVTPPNSKIKFGTREIYVDVPAEIYKLYELWTLTLTITSRNTNFTNV